MSISDKVLKEAAKKLLDPSSSVDQLLSILDNVLRSISMVDQSPPRSTMNALSPLMEALVAPELLKHSNLDVKVSVAACIIQITRVTAPGLPYDDEQMKEVYQLIVSSFQHLYDMSSRSYTTRILILDTVSAIKFCNAMLNLECYALLIEMFQHFLEGIRDHHTVQVFLDMVNIMTHVLEEIVDIPPEMLLPILRYVTKNTQIPQVSQRLAEQVLISCDRELETYLAEAVKSSGFSLDNYSNVVASICEGSFSACKQNAVVANRKDDRHGPTELGVKDKPEAAEVSTSISSLDGHEEALSPRREIVAEAGVRTRERRTLEITEEEDDPAESATGIHKRARVGEAHGETEKTAPEGEPACRTEKSSPEPPHPCSFIHQVAKVKQSIVNTLSSVGQFRSELETKEQSIGHTSTIVGQFLSEIKKMENYLDAWLQGFDVLGEKTSGIHQPLDS